MKEITNYLDRLIVNNNRPWFNEHKEEYLYVQNKFNRFSKELIARIADFDPSTAGLELKDCTYRIYRDIRFSLDKSPYKTHFGVYVCPGGKKSGNAGYYFHLEAKESEYIGRNLLACGIYNPTPALTKMIREEINANGAAFDAAIKEAKDFEYDERELLCRVPNGYSKEFEYEKYLRMRTFSLAAPLPDEVLYGDHLMEYVVEQFRSAKRYNDFLNRIKNL